MKLSLRTIRGRVIEAVAVIVLVLIFFLTLVVVLNAVFPTGQSFMGMFKPWGDDGTLTGEQAAARELRLSTGAGEIGLGDQAGSIAVLNRTRNRVQSKRAEQVAWRKATENMTLHNKDAVQTFRNSSAVISFTEGNTLDMDENSLIVIMEMERDVFTRESRRTVVLMGGQLSAEVRDTDEGRNNLEVLLPAAVAHVPSRSRRDQPARFRIKVNPDDTSLLTVLEGTADVTVDGETTVLGKGQMVRMEQGRPITYLRGPPGPPVLAYPADGEVFDYRSVPPKVTFGWRGSSDAGGYRFVLAEDPGFRRIVYEGPVDDNRFDHGNLKPGDYYWKVRSINRDGEGAFSRPRHFRLIQDLEPPTLMVDYPESGEAGDRFELRGRTDPGARIFVGGMPVEIDENGEFVHNMFLKRGYNVIVVEAVDEVGNVAYFSRVVNVEF